MMTIYGDKRSGNCLKVLYAVKLLGLDHNWVDVDILSGETRRPAFLAKNPAGQIPVVELDDGRCLAQSNAILLYLARGSDLVPTEPWPWARMMEWLFWEQYSHEPTIAVCRFQKLYLGKPDHELDPDRLEKGNRALDQMEAHLSANTWLAGDALSVADISLVAYTRLAHEGSFDLTARVSIRRWIVDVERAMSL